MLASVNDIRRTVPAMLRMLASVNDIRRTVPAMLFAEGHNENRPRYVVTAQQEPSPLCCNNITRTVPVMLQQHNKNRPRYVPVMFCYVLC